MKNLIIILLFLTSFSVSSQANDSLKLRIYNNEKYFLKELKIKVDEREYVFKNVRKNKYSEFVNLPYIWSGSNQITITVRIRRTVIQKTINYYNQWITLIKIPIDHAEEKKIDRGYFTLKINTQIKHAKLSLETSLIKE